MPSSTLQQPTSPPGEPTTLPASAVVIQLRSPLLRPDAVLQLQVQTGWSDEELVAILRGLAFAEKETGKPVRLEDVDMLAHPAYASNQTDFISGPQLIGQWLGKGSMTTSSVVLPDQSLRATAAQGFPDAEPVDVFEGFWRQCRLHGWTAAAPDFPPLGSVRISTDSVLFWKLFDLMTCGVRAILSASGLVEVPAAPTGHRGLFLEWPREVADTTSLVNELRGQSRLTKAQEAAVAAAASLLGAG